MKKKIAGFIFSIMMCLAFICSLPMLNARAEEDQKPLTTIGDINGDGTINAMDVTVLRRYLAGGWGVSIVNEESDLNKDGDVSAMDVTLLRRFLAGGWGVVLPQKAVLTPLAVSETGLDTFMISFNMKVSDVKKEDVTAYYLEGEEKEHFNIASVRAYENELTVQLDSQLPQGKEIFVEFKEASVGSFVSATFTQNSVKAVMVPNQTITAGKVVSLQYKLLDQNGIDITGLLGSTLTGTVISETENADIDVYIVSGNDPSIYIGTPNKEYKVKIKYTWIDLEGITYTCEGWGMVASVPEEPWSIGVVTGVITLESEQDYVRSDHKGYNNVQSISPLTLDYTDVVLQIAISYQRGYETLIDTRNYINGCNIASYPDRKVFVAYELLSTDESVVTISPYLDSENRTKLVLNKSGSTSIIIYGVDDLGSKTAVGVIPVQVMPKKSSALYDLGEKYVYDNTILSDMIVTSADADDFVKADGTKNNMLKAAECSMDAPEANVIQIAVPYTNIDGTIYAGLEGGPLSDEFTEYLFESSDESVIGIGEIVSGRLKLICRNFGFATVSLYGKTPEGEKILLASKEIKVSRSTANSPVIESVSQVSLDTISIAFDRDVEDMGLWTGDYGLYYYITETVKLYVNGAIQSVDVSGKNALVKLSSQFVQGNKYYLEFVGKLAGDFTAVSVDANSAARVAFSSQKIMPNEYSEISYRLLDENGIDITDAYGKELNGIVSFNVKNQAACPFAIIKGNQIYLAENDCACVVEGMYVWYDANGVEQHTAAEEAVFSTGEGIVISTEVNPEDYPAEPVPVRMEVYTFKGSEVSGSNTSKMINSAYEADSLSILVNVLDQYGEKMDGISVNVEKLDSSIADYSGSDTYVSNTVYVIKPSDVSGSGELNLKLSCGTGTDKLTNVVSIIVGNETEAVRYTLQLSKNKLDTAIREDTECDIIYVRAEGVTRGGFKTVGVGAMFTNQQPKPVTNIMESAENYPMYLFTVSKDGVIMNANQLPTFLGDGFANVVNSSYGNAMKMAAGKYDVRLFEIRYINGMLIPTLMGIQSFTVEDNQPELTVTATENINKLTVLSSIPISSAFDVTCEGTKISPEELLFDYTVNGTDTTAYVQKVAYTIKNINGLGDFTVYKDVDMLAKKDVAEPIVVESDGTLTEWERGAASGIVADIYASDYVTDNSINPNCRKINVLSKDYDRKTAVQIAVPYSKDGETVIETLGSTSVSGYTDYLLRSNDEKVLMLGRILSENRVELIFNNEGSTTISIYGVRPDGKLEYISDMDIRIAPARKASTFSVTSSKNRLNLAFAPDRIDFRIQVRDQYGDEMSGQMIRVRSLTGNVQLLSEGVFTSNVFTLYPGAIYMPGSGGGSTLVLEFSCDNLKMTSYVSIGNEAQTVRYVPMLSRTGLSIANAGVYGRTDVTVAVNGKTSGGYDSEGAIPYYTESIPSGDNAYDALSENIKAALDADGFAIVYTVKKDEELQKAGDLPTMFDNHFYNYIMANDEEIITMNPGNYTLEFYKISRNNLAEVMLIGKSAFSVTE